MAIRESGFKSRKVLRKEARKAKKQRRNEYYAKRGKRKVSKDDVKKINSKKIKSEEYEFKNLQEEQNYEMKLEKNKRKILEKEIKKKRIERLKEDNVKEEKEIKKLEKQLKFRKGKRSSAFALDGLDFLLDICDRKISNSETNNTFQESDTEFDDDLATVTGNKKKNSSEEKKCSSIVNEESDISSDESVFNSEEEEISENSGNQRKAVKLKKKKRHISDVEYSASDVKDSKKLKNKKCKKEKQVKFVGILDSDEDEDENEGESEGEGEGEGDDDDDDDDDEDFEALNEVQDDLDDMEPKKKKIKKKEKKKRNKKEKVTKQAEQKAEVKDETRKKKICKGSVDKFDPCSRDQQSEGISEHKSSDEVIDKSTGVWEDIYGRTRDKEGNIVKAYKPPQLRKALEGGSKNQEKLIRLRRQLKGLLNRLAENNMASVASQIEELYMSHSRNEMNETLKDLFSEAIVTEVLTPEKLIAEHAMLIAILHANIGSEIGGYFLQFAVTQLYKMLNDGDIKVEDKSVNNLLAFVMQLYNFQIFHSKLMYDLIHELLKNLEEKQIELLLLMLRTVGFSLRKDDPVALKSVVLKIQQEANSLSDNSENYSRMKYMLEVVSAIKNNNVSKIPNYNPEMVEHLKKCMKVLIRKGNYKTELNISLQDLLNADEHGKWWIVGSAWSGSGPIENAAKSSQSDEVKLNKISFSQKLFDLAKKQRMNTDVRRTIFCTLMSAEDYLDAFERLLKLGLKGAVEREIINVLLHCALQEKDFNPFYFHLANKFCVFDRKYQIMIQYAVWDKVKELNNMLPIQITNLAKFLGNIIINKGLPLSVLKVIQFSELDKIGVKFVRQVLLTILLTDEETVATIFSRIVHSAKLKIFRDGIRLFLHHFLIKNIKNTPDENSNHLLKMIEIADKVLTLSDLRMIF